MPNLTRKQRDEAIEKYREMERAYYGENLSESVFDTPVKAVIKVPNPERHLAYLGYQLWICKFSDGWKWEVDFEYLHKHFHAEGIEVSNTACFESAKQYRHSQCHHNK